MSLKHLRLLRASTMAAPSVERCGLQVLRHEPHASRSTFLAGTVIGDGNWCALNLHWYEYESSEAHAPNDIFIGRLSSDLLGILRDVFNPQSTEALVQQHGGELEDLIHREVVGQGCRIPRLMVRGYYVNNPDLESLTWDEARSCHVGLHIDKIEQKSSKLARERSPRLSINIGRDRRFFLFADITSDVLAEWNFESSTSASFGSHRELRHYCQKQKGLSAYRIGLPPGCFYVANTEYVVHDGSNSGSAKADEQLVLMSEDAMLALLKAH